MHAIDLVPGAPVHGGAIPDLVWSTGPASYRYIFGDRAAFDRFVGASWVTPDSYFGHTEATVAVRDGAVVGLEIGYDGARNYETKANLGAVSTTLIERGALTLPALEAILARADRASYLNPFIPPTAYYVLALAVAPSVRGTGLGARLLSHAMERAHRRGCRQFHLDVLSDNPAVGFYRARGLETMAETVAPEPCRRHGVPMELRMATMLAGGAA